MNTLKAQIEAVAVFADLHPRAALLLQNFFLELTTEAEEEELSAWTHENVANEKLFDLFVELNAEGPGAITPHLLAKLKKKAPLPKKRRRIRKIILWTLGSMLALLIADFFIPIHPLTWLVRGKKPPEGNDQTAVVWAEKETKIFWLSDSTRVELYPNSTLTYRDPFFWKRTVVLKGSARFHIRYDVMGNLFVDAGLVKTESGPGNLLVITDSTGKVSVSKPGN
ncbi:hypothetical protein [Flavihumibacter petaseus]|uniref:FecR protein domain-containing protein n=1 Tax=Flavihumibacter petaseus NBRC 106054 TaxID=1220578 RepID=A0A0E9N6R6_9BACT|nr:hypothetical protein [Flavihumibacter petaseus]GAO45386.1 hypothetical protein FPE01S_05_00830 [Flavihumibacter petaseus NBRC 106054]